MAGLDDLYSQIPTSEIATKLGVDEGEVDSAVHTLVPVLLGGLQHNSQDPEHAGRIEAAASSHAASGLLDAGGGVDQAGEGDGQQAVAALFGGNDTDQVAAALAKGGAGNSDLLKQLLPILLPMVLAYIGKRLGTDGAQTTTAHKRGSLRRRPGRYPGQHPRWRVRSGDKSLGGVLGSVLGGKGGALGEILGGLLGGKK